MKSRRTYSRAKTFFAISVIFLLAAIVVSAQSRAPKFKVLHTFQGAPNDGSLPHGVIIRDSQGNVYGTTGAGGGGTQCGSEGCGTAFKMNKASKLIWLHSFTGANGSGSMAGLLRDKTGAMYGTTTFGGIITNICPGGCGLVFRLDKTGRETVLYRFDGKYSDGSNPEALLVTNMSGNLYGTTYEGDGYGTVFKVNQAGKETILHHFTGPINGGGDGAFPYPGVILDASGNIYGVASAGGADGYGAVYKLDAKGTETLLYSFQGSDDGGGPFSVLVADAEGNLYGTTQGGGNSECGGVGCGVIFELSPQTDGSWTESALYAFCSQPNCADGERPLDGPLVRDTSGSLYGTTYFGGANDDGVVFKLDRTGKETVLHSFTGGADGADPWAGLTADAAGNLYGTAVYGGNDACDPPDGCGVVFKITP
jgi:uncharacterized repeat protein (TIGR03803 family)